MILIHAAMPSICMIHTLCFTPLCFWPCSSSLVDSFAPNINHSLLEIAKKKNLLHIFCFQLIYCYIPLWYKYGPLGVTLIKPCISKNFAATLCRSEGGGGGGPVQPRRLLRANADCTIFLFPLYCFPFCPL